MCYNIAAATKQEIQYALQRGDVHLAEELKKQLEDIELTKNPKFFSSGFENAKLLVFTNDEPYRPQLFSWGMICSDTTNPKLEKQLIARSETMFELKSFQVIAKNRRCLIYADAFFEYHHQDSKAYPFRVSMKDSSPMVLAGLWNETKDGATGELIRTVAVVTIEPEKNSLMDRVHNKPKNSLTSRMPLILTKQNQNDWLMEVKTFGDMKSLLAIAKPIQDSFLTAHSVPQLIGKAGVGNTELASTRFNYPELKLQTV